MIFAALSDPTRREMIERLVRDGETRVTDLASTACMKDKALPTISKHLRVLEEAGLVSRRIDGREHWISAETTQLEMAGTWIGLQQDR